MSAPRSEGSLWQCCPRSSQGQQRKQRTWSSRHQPSLGYERKVTLSPGCCMKWVTVSQHLQPWKWECVQNGHLIADQPHLFHLHLARLLQDPWQEAVISSETTHQVPGSLLQCACGHLSSRSWSSQFLAVASDFGSGNGTYWEPK